MEIIDIFDENSNYIRKARRGDRLNDTEYFKFIHVWIIEDNKILIQKRGYDRKWAAGKWATHTGVVASGENEDDCAIREVKEEMGIFLDSSKVELGFTFKLKGRLKALGYVYFAEVKGSAVTIDNYEVIDYKYVNYSTLKSMVDENKFIKYGSNNVDDSNYFDLVFNKLETMLEV